MELLNVYNFDLCYLLNIFKQNLMNETSENTSKTLAKCFPVKLNMNRVWKTSLSCQIRVKFAQLKF